LVIHPNDVLILESGGGGGWGNPAERDPVAVANDVENGFVAIGDPDANTPPLAGDGMGGG
jgi:N-methylhydantoinase B